MIKRKKPIIKGILEPYSEPFECALQDCRIEYQELTNITIKDFKDVRMVFDTVVFTDCIFSDCILNHSEFIDCVFINCNFTNNRLEHAQIVRTEFKTSKLAGTSFIDSKLEHVLIQDCICKYLECTNSTVKNVEINHSNLDESTWFETALKDIELQDVSLMKSDFYQTPLKGIDLSDCVIEGMKINVEGIQGTTINPEQAVLLCSLIGVTVKEH